MKVSEQFALNEWLSEYPAKVSYDEVAELLRDEDESVTVWAWFENMSRYELAENIDNTRSHFEAVVGDLALREAV
jgi:hypothetical protein